MSFDRTTFLRFGLFLSVVLTVIVLPMAATGCNTIEKMGEGIAEDAREEKREDELEEMRENDYD